MKFHIRPRQIISCFFAALFIFIFALYCSGRVGWFLMLALVLTPLFSVLLTYLCKNSIEIYSVLNHDLMSRGDHCVLSVTLKNRSFLPCPPVRLTVYDSPSVVCSENDRVISVYILPKKSTQISVTFTAELAGGSLVGIDSAVLCDYFSICSARLGREDEFLFRTGVIPDIHRVNAATDLLLSAHDSFASDNNDETVDETSLFSGGFPGYEYRPYRPGDPLKRINSKISAKRDSLMVRLDERQASSVITLILNPFMKNPDPQLSQAVLEETLGMILSLLNLDLAVTFFYMDDEKWIREGIFSEDDLIILSRKLAFHMFSDKAGTVLPSEDTATPGVIICQAEISSENTSGLSREGCHIYAVASGEWRHI